MKPKTAKRKPKKKIKTVCLFTNRNCMVFDEQGEQMVKYQRAISCYKVDKKLAMEVATSGAELFLSQWRAWMHPISSKEFQYLLGLRTRAMDLAEIDTAKDLRGEQK